MSEVKSEIILWLQNKPDWLQKAAEKILFQRDIESEDIKELTKILKRNQQQASRNTFQDLSTNLSVRKNLRIESIGEIEGIDKLDSEKPLKFGNINLSVIYGSNGSGKSGYVRILKKICGKPRANNLLSNIFNDPPENQGCEIHYRVDNEKKSLKWNVNDDSITELECVDIFDNDEAKFYLSEETTVSFIPAEISLFEKLVEVCELIQQEIQTEIDTLNSKKPKLPPKFHSTKMGELYESISDRTNTDILTDLTSWAETDQKKLEQLEERLKDSYPDNLANTKRERKHNIDKLIETIEKVYNKLNCKMISSFQSLKSTADAKRKSVIEGAKVQTGTAKLEGIGSESWRALWNAAKEYSIQKAYPGKEFPVNDPNSRCVLCHQKLNEIATKRMQEFDEFVKGKLESEAEQAESRLQNAYQELKKIIPDKQSIELLLLKSKLDQEQEEEVKGYWKLITRKSKKILDAKTDEKIKGLYPPISLFDSLKKVSESIQSEIVQHESDIDKFDPQRLQSDVLNLMAKKWISQQKEAILEEVNLVKKRTTLENQKKMANSRDISVQASKISQRVITNAYISRFNTELNELGAKQIQVELVKTRAKRGRIMHKIKIRNAEQQNENPSIILSDGERRIVSLAAFLANVKGHPEMTPFVFDDPISSLDNVFEEQVAMRLAKLAEERQVIVFTHRLSLCGVLEDVAEKIRSKTKSRLKNIEYICIESFAGSTGRPSDDIFWAKSIEAAIKKISTILDKVKKFWDSHDSKNYKIHAKSFCSDFRKLLERIIEEDLLNDIVKRHRRNVKTNNKLLPLAEIKKEDCLLIDELMTKYSKFQHSQSEEMPVQIPDEECLRKDMKNLEYWRCSFKKRMKKS